MWVAPPSCCCKLRISLRRRTRSIASSADSGSSSSSNLGAVARARARAIRCCWPPESCAGYFFTAAGKPIIVSNSATHPCPPRLNLCALGTAIDQAIRHILGHRQIGKQGIRLEHDAVVALLRRQPRNIAAILRDAARSLAFQTSDDAQQGRLAATGRAEKDQHLALPHLQIHVP